LNGTFVGLRNKIRKLVPCICKVCKAAMTPHLYNFAELLERKHVGKTSIECSISPFETVQVGALLEGIGYLTKYVDLSNPSERLGGQVKQVRIFLASSQELEFDRKEFQLFIGHENNYYIKEGVFLELEIWEDAIQAISKTRMQDRYNEMARRSDIFVCLLHKEASAATEEEFEAALGQFLSAGKPLVYTYFKDARVDITALNPAGVHSLFQFKDRLAALGHAPGIFHDIDGLKYQFSNQLKKVLHGE
jgi:internalin A